MKNVQLFFASVVVLLLQAYSTLMSCPNCKDAYDAGSGDAGIGESYSWSVVFFLTMFTGLLLFGYFFMRWQFQKHSALKQAHN